jgi:hypothetical protein
MERVANIEIVTASTRVMAEKHIRSKISRKEVSASTPQFDTQALVLYNPAITF